MLQLQLFLAIEMSRADPFNENLKENKWKDG